MITIKVEPEMTATSGKAIHECRKSFFDVVNDTFDKHNKQILRELKLNRILEKDEIIGEDTTERIVADKIVTNGNLGSVLQDSVDYKADPIFNSTTLLNSSTKPMYILGTYRDLPLHVDAMMRWDDNRILIKKGEETIETIMVEDKYGILI